MAHQHYTGTGKMHSFRGLLAHEEQQRIRIEGAVGAIAWRITKFELMGSTPGDNSPEHVAKIYREKQTSAEATWATIDFTEDELLAAAIWQKSSGVANALSDDVIFDNQLFVRNIYILQRDIGASTSCNYYIELEEVKVSAAGMAQLAVAAARRTTLAGA
jgi:hypothetical protein